MSKVIKTYGVKGLMECVYYIPVGKAKLKLNFTGGVLTAYGNTPAKYTTDDPVKQAIIENSALFKSGKVELTRERVIDAAPVNDQAAPVSDQAAPVSDRKHYASPLHSMGCNTDKPLGELTAMTMSSLAEARDYLMKNFSYAASSLTSTDKIKAAGKAHGIDITIQ